MKYYSEINIPDEGIESFKSVPKAVEIDCDFGITTTLTTGRSTQTLLSLMHGWKIHNGMLKQEVLD